MKNKNKINEEDKFKIHVDKETLLDPKKTKELAMMKKKNPNIEFDLETSVGSSQSSTSMTQMEENELFETDGIIEPQDQATIKYLSNVKDVNTGNVSQPFTIADKNYQMVRGVYPDGNVDMAVYCLDDMDDLGNNIIYSIDEFEQKIALPMKEKLELESKQLKSDNDTYEGYKHFFVNKKTNEVKKFRTIEEMLSCNKKEEEEYMSTPRFKTYMTEKLFGKRNRNRLNELGMDQANLEPAQGSQNPQNQNAGLADDEDKLSGKAKLLIKQIDSITAVSNNMDSVRDEGTDKAKAIVLAALAERIGVPMNKISTIVSSIKNIAKTQTPVTEGLKEKKNVIKTIKVKDIK